MLRELEDNEDNEEVVNGIKINNLCYADKIVPIATSQEDFQNLLILSARSAADTGSKSPVP